MKSNYKTLGKYIQLVNIRNKDLQVETLLGVSIKKILMPSIANTVGTNMKTYKIIAKNQFAYGPVTSRNGDKISIALLEDFDVAIVSQAYTVFEVIDDNVLHPEYLMMWFRRPEFDRYARFRSHGSAREVFDWDELCETELPIPSIEKQREIVKEYNTVVNRIKLNETLNKKLEETAQALYKHWFVDFEFPISKESYPELISEFPELEGKPYKSSGGKMVYNEELDKEIPVGWGKENVSSFIDIKYGKDYKHLSEGNIPLYGSGGIMKYVNDILYDKPSVLIPRKGSLQNILLVDEPFWSVDTMFYSKIKEIYNRYYIYYFLRTIDFYALNHGAAVPSTTSELLNNLQLINPKEDVLKDFDYMVEKLFKNIKENNNKSKVLKVLESLLLAKMTKVEEKKIA